MFRYRKNYKNYKNHNDGQCPFCHPIKQNIIEETSLSLVIKSTYPYSLWEVRDVIEHNLIVPKRHRGSLADLTPAEQQDMVQLMAKYEKLGYDVYSRGTGSVQRTIPLHQHTHLFKTSRKPARLVFFSKKPYFLFKI